MEVEDYIKADRKGRKPKPVIDREETGKKKYIRKDKYKKWRNNLEDSD